MKRSSLLLRICATATLLIVNTQVWAQHLEVSKNAPVREDSLFDACEIARVKPGDYLILSDPNKLFGTGYWQVILPSEQIGYLYKTHVRLREGAIPNSYTAYQTTEESDGELQVHIINVGQADAILIICPDGQHQMVIDSGELNLGIRYLGSTIEFQHYMNAFQARNDKIEVVIATHPHSDHIAGMKWLVENYMIDLYVDNGREYDSGTYRSLELALITEEINRHSITETQLPNIDFCSRLDVNAQILRPSGFNDSGMDDNDYSVIVRVDYKDNSFLFMGDAEKLMEERLLADLNTRQSLDVDWLKVGHHGSHSSSTQEFLEQVTPQYAAISNGGDGVYTNESFKHPRFVTLNKLIPFVEERTGIAVPLEYYNAESDQWNQVLTKAAVYQTSTEGELIFYSDGSTIWRRVDKE